MASERVTYFGAGPTALPTPVLEEAAQGLLNFEGTGVGIAEISHRSKEFSAFAARLEQRVRTLLAVPPTHHILFAQGGATTQFSAIVLNMLARHRLLHPEATPAETTLDYVITGSWSKKAAEEARRLGGATVHVAADSRLHSPEGKFDNIPPRDGYTFSADPALIYYCENETVDGVQFAPSSSEPGGFPFELLPRPSATPLLPLVADYSSSFMSRPIPRLAEHAVVYAGAQKNIGPAGLTVLIVREDCLVDVDAAARLGAAPVPLMLAWRTLSDSQSLYNTPPVLAMYVAGLVLQRMEQQGGLEYYGKLNKGKKERVYGAIAEGEAKGVFRKKVRDGSESWMNAVFEVIGEGAEKRFLDGAEKRGMKGLKGHRCVSSLSLYLSPLTSIHHPQVCWRHPGLAVQRHHGRASGRAC